MDWATRSPDCHLPEAVRPCIETGWEEDARGWTDHDVTSDRAPPGNNIQHLRSGARKRYDIGGIGIGNPRERRVGKRREVISSVRPFAVTQGADEVVLRPASNSRLWVGRDVRAVKGPERRLERAPTRIRNRVLFVFSMAAYAPAGLRQILPAR